MLETSKDLLNIMLGSAVLIVALMFSWLLYQTARTIKGLNDTMQVVQDLVKNIDEGVKNFKSKAGNVAAFFTVILKSAQTILAAINKKTSSTKKQK
ncbi:MAG: hypothetical protein A2611_03435 [Candidatus Komeilibacteria bacterium RIFOXYD1_FULL_37_29]|nr:MAG: hypothetical protein A2611_03435 [Candidatus Komeilibacteria bacterium RIFOXYD1_FULL_37_29]